VIFYTKYFHASLPTPLYVHINFRSIIRYSYINVYILSNCNISVPVSVCLFHFCRSPVADTMRAMKIDPPRQSSLSVSIVLHHSSLEMLARVLQSLYRSATSAHAAGCVDRVTVQVLDNSSDQEFRNRALLEVDAWPENDFFRVVYQGLRDNRGFGASHNMALAHLQSEFHLVLNPDAELAEDALRIGLSSLQEDQSIVLLSPKVRGEGGAQEFLCKRYPSLLVLMLRPFAPRFIRRIFRKRLYHYEMRDVCSGSQEADILLASGCFMLVRTAALKSVGGFNDKYFLYFEDFDLSIRLGSQGRLVFNPAIQIAHHGGYAAQKGMQHVKYFIRSGLTFFREHGWRWI
jgi:GT2 family glycosyltransferase